MLKISAFRGQTEQGPTVIPLFGPADATFEKVAAPTLLPDVTRYIASLRPRNDAQYTLVSAMGASEWWGSNINGDAFDEASLIHAPDDLTGNPLIDKPRVKDWAYGFPTFYYAHPYAHHRNKDASRAFGEVELALWNPHMKRVELVTRVDKELCQKFGGTGVWDKLKAGEFPDVSMGCAPAGTRITMFDGRQVPIESVQEGDFVLSHTGKTRRVEKTMQRRYRGTLYEFKVYGFRRDLPLTDEHPLWLVRAEQLVCSPSSSLVNKGRKQRHCTPLVKDRSKGCADCGTMPHYKFSWIRADEAEVGDYLAFPVPGGVDETVQSVEEARFLGYYLAEGFVGNYNKRPLEQITFSLNFQEKEIAEDIERLARHLGAQIVWHAEQPEKGGRSVHVVHKNLASRCLAFCGSGARTKTVSREVLYMSPDLQLPFLGAYLDGDGGTYKGAAYFSTASEQLAGQLFVLLARCGVIASVNEIEHSPSERSIVRKDTTEYQVWVGTDFSPMLGAHTRKPVRPSLKVRGQRFFYAYEGTTYIMSPILEIEEKHYDDTVFNFSVEEDDSYVAEMLATHNCKVPFDTCSICLDWEKYRKAQGTFDPKKHKHPGEAVLAFHKKLKEQHGHGIRGLSITRADYCEHARHSMNKILPDGRKVFVRNDYPRFFDISFVFIGADKTAKVMMKIAEGGRAFWSLGGAELAEKLGYDNGGDALETLFLPNAGVEKTASGDPFETFLLGKQAKEKDGEITKDVVPSQFAGKAVPLLTKNEPHLPNELLDQMSRLPLEQALSTPTGLGIILRPREFQRIVLIQLGKRDVANELDARGEVFPESKSNETVEMGPEFFNPALARLLLPLLAERSLLGPFIEKRVVVLAASVGEKKNRSSSLSSDLLHKMGAAYNGYRDGVMNLVANAQSLAVTTASSDGTLNKVASASIHEVFTPLSAAYILDAFLDEVA